MKQQPYNLQIKNIFYKHCKNLKKMIKRKKYLYIKSILNKLIHWKETDLKLYWQILNNLRFEDDTRNSSYETHINWE